MIVPGLPYLWVKTQRRAHILHLNIIHAGYIGYGRNHLRVFLIVQYTGDIFSQWQELVGQGRPASSLLLWWFLTKKSGVLVTLPMVRFIL